MKDWKKAVAKLLVLVMAVSAALPLGGSVQVEAAKRPKDVYKRQLDDYEQLKKVNMARGKTQSKYCLLYTTRCV